jgi:hypothetical protein
LAPALSLVIVEKTLWLMGGVGKEQVPTADIYVEVNRVWYVICTVGKLTKSGCFGFSLNLKWNLINGQKDRLPNGKVGRQKSKRSIYTIILTPVQIVLL